jgi:predicted phage tail protein
MSDTPRTDAKYKEHAWDVHDNIPLEFCQQLERELNEAREAIALLMPFIMEDYECGMYTEQYGKAIKAAMKVHNES